MKIIKPALNAFFLFDTSKAAARRVPAQRLRRIKRPAVHELARLASAMNNV